MTFHSYWANVKRYVPPSAKELSEFLIIALVFGFALSFNQWGDVEFDAAVGVRNLLIATVLAGIALAVHHGAQRLMALKYDVRTEHHIWWNGIILSLLIAFLSRGAFPFLAATGTRVVDMPLHRLGHFRYKSGTMVLSAVTAAGPVANMLVAILLWGLTASQPYLATPTMSLFITINVVMAVLNMLPVPPLDGLHTFFVARTAYATIFGAVLAAALGLALADITLGTLLLLILFGAVLAGILWHKVFER